jgi:uncharacterized iron-regulated membrane protein
MYYKNRQRFVQVRIQPLLRWAIYKCDAVNNRGRRRRGGLPVSLTGIVLAWPDSFERAVQMATGEGQPAKAIRTTAAKREGNEPTLPLDAYVNAAVASIPGGTLRELRMPNRGRAVVSIRLSAPGDVRPKGENLVLLSQESAQVLSVERSSDAPLSARLVAIANAVHKTELGGLPVKLVWSVLGLVPVVLFLSGLQIWWRRKRTPPKGERAGAGIKTAA